MRLEQLDQSNQMEHKELCCRSALHPMKKRALLTAQANLTSELELRMKQVVFLRFALSTTSTEVKKGKKSCLAAEPSTKL